MWRKISLVLTCAFLFAPTVRTMAQHMDTDQKVDQAVRLMDDGLYSESRDLLKAVLAVAPDNYRALYETAFLHYLQEEYKAAVKIAEKLKNTPEADDLVYQLLGNSYDYMGDRRKAIDAYKQGLAKFPRSGKLYLELGNIAYNSRDYQSALSCFEQGIAAEPTFPSNYFNVSGIFFMTTEPVWGMFYGEIFANLERGSERTRKMSRYLYNAYREYIKIGEGEKPGEKTLSISFSKNDNIVMTGDSLFVMPFGTGVYESALGLSFPMEADSVDMAAINTMRCNFVKNYFTTLDGLRGRTANIPDAPDVLMAYQRRIAEAGHMEAYNYWLLMEGDDEQIGVWYDAHREEWDAFMEWFRENPLQVDKEHYFHRSQYDGPRNEQ